MKLTLNLSLPFTLIFIIFIYFKIVLEIVVEVLFLIGAVLNVYNYGAIYDKNKKIDLAFGKMILYTCSASVYFASVIILWLKFKYHTLTIIVIGFLLSFILSICDIVSPSLDLIAQNHNFSNQSKYKI